MEGENHKVCTSISFIWTSHFFLCAYGFLSVYKSVRTLVGFLDITWNTLNQSISLSFYLSLSLSHTILNSSFAKNYKATNFIRQEGY